MTPPPLSQFRLTLNYPIQSSELKGNPPDHGTLGISDHMDDDAEDSDYINSSGDESDEDISLPDKMTGRCCMRPLS